MANAGDELVDPSGLRLRFVETAESTGGTAVSLDWLVPPGGRLVALPHVHPFDDEVFEIVAGRARYRVGRHVYERSAPYTYAVPRARAAGPGPRHRRVRRPAPVGGHAERPAVPFAYLPWLPAGVQETLIGGLAGLARRRGYAAHVEPERAGALAAAA
jgi:hypothetical protein